MGIFILSLSKTAPIEELVLAIRCCLAGKVMLPITLLQRLRKKEVHISIEKNTYQEMVIEKISFNEGELQILAGVAQGLKIGKWLKPCSLAKEQ